MFQRWEIILCGTGKNNIYSKFGKKICFLFMSSVFGTIRSKFIWEVGSEAERPPASGLRKAQKVAQKRAHLRVEDVKNKIIWIVQSHGTWTPFFDFFRRGVRRPFGQQPAVSLPVHYTVLYVWLKSVIRKGNCSERTYVQHKVQHMISW
jgi:hypothetical protein